MSGNVASQSAAVEARAPQTAQMRAFVAGRSAVLASEAYLIRLPGNTDETYKLYAGRSYFLNATARSIDGLTGLIFRKSPVVNIPPALEAYSNDLTRAGQSAAKFAEQIVEEVLTVGWCGVLVDHPASNEDFLMRAQMEAANIRPYARLYTAESILGWRETVIGADKALAQVRLLERTQEQDPRDEFSTVTVERVRVLDLEEGAYRVRVYEKVKKDWVLISEAWPQIDGNRQSRIPFRFINRRGAEAIAAKPPLLDLAQTNCAHLNDSALYQWGLMWTANPTPCFVNLTMEEGESLALGSSTGLKFGEGGSAFFLEFSGQGLASIRQAMEDKRRDMAVLGARMLMEDRKQVEAAATAEIHRAGENSVLAAIAASVSEAMVWTLERVAEWAGLGALDIRFDLNRDYIATQMDAQRLTGLMMAWQGGGITRADLFENLQRGEVIRSEKTLEEHTDELDNEAPVLPAMPNVSQ
jgi:hypothetical protein